ncbi:2-haloalkanoic acid dehalogenase [Pokkaliibacter plantistimulans]|uniref:2-haloalkanoic acid dehalogenase n=1 Tax=Proteobacteria bacterium 228 TaxID=2083153 RepID=A0A2S5KIU6_9PROT|nr:2-haloalkanoic acid dehalogenase [Pokkaliibacter plantistimulans]PPC74286.1 2-haloalkanoic acid dehalogenase [Pokkaliibacter plantistimulans]
MHLTDYQALLIDCDGVLIDHESGIWSALQQFQQNLPHDALNRQQLMSDYHRTLNELMPRLSELGFTGCLCFAYRQLMESHGYQPSWRESLRFARAVVNWPLFEDAPGALLYLRKFYRVLVRCDRETEDVPSLCERLGVSAKEVIIRGETPEEEKRQLAERGVYPDHLLLVTNACLAAKNSYPAICLLQRPGSLMKKQPKTKLRISSLAELVFQHQESLRH